MNSYWSYSLETSSLGQNRRFFVQCNLEIWRMTLKNNRAHLLFYFKLFEPFHNRLWIQTWLTLSPERLYLGQNRQFCCPVWPGNSMDDLKKSNRTPFLCYFKLSALFHNHWWIQTGVTVRKRSNWGQLFWPLWPLLLTSDPDLLHGHHFCQWW